MVMQYDVFNGDADGIFALHQLRLAKPVADAQLITGVKRDINLLRYINDVSQSSICVLDISLDKNKEPLLKLLNEGNTIFYADHHFAGEIPDSNALEYHIEATAEICTSLIINRLLEGRYITWAICGAFGDNLHRQVQRLADELGLDSEQYEVLREMGELFNYNGYGAKIEDLHFHPADLYLAIQPYSDPFDFYRSTDLVTQLKDGYQEDMAKALKQKNISDRKANRLYIFPAESWARRIVGLFSNLKAREKEDAAHAIIVENDDSSYQISVRAPLQARENADTLCRMFPTGGGRAAAAGINHLPPDMLDEFIDAFYAMYDR